MPSGNCRNVGIVSQGRPCHHSTSLASSNIGKGVGHEKGGVPPGRLYEKWWQFMRIAVLLAAVRGAAAITADGDPVAGAFLEAVDGIAQAKSKTPATRSIMRQLTIANAGSTLGHDLVENFTGWSAVRTFAFPAKLGPRNWRSRMRRG